MSKRLNGRAWAAWLAGLACGCAAWAAAVSNDDASATRAVIEAQLAAFAADDGERAFSFAAPELRAAVGSAERFMAMVRQSYRPVYRSVSRSFLMPEWVDGEVVQGVHLVDAEGRLWLAVYRLRKLPDRHWVINGCALAPAEAQMTRSPGRAAVTA